MKIAVQNCQLDPRNQIGVKNFRKNVKVLKIDDIPFIPASDYEEGRKISRDRQLEALHKGRDRRLKIYSSMRQAMFGVVKQPHGEEFPMWDELPSNVSLDDWNDLQKRAG